MDRNAGRNIKRRMRRTSLSARRAWIEIVDVNGVQGYRTLVALRKESVDRNRLFPTWVFRSRVALRKESVDRNGIEKRLDGF